MQITDRTKDLVKSGGEWISTVDLENEIMAHPKVMEAAVIAIPDEKWQERPLAQHVQKWQFKRGKTEFRAIGTTDKTFSHYHLAPDGWEDLPGGAQRLCYNEIPTKVNWTYLRFDFDLETMRALAFQCNDRSFDLSEFDSIRMPAMKNLWCMLNLCVFAETDTDKRTFLYVDSICVSGDF
jgi:hypothetical protein